MKTKKETENQVKEYSIFKLKEETEENSPLGEVLSRGLVIAKKKLKLLGVSRLVHQSFWDKDNLVSF